MAKPTLSFWQIWNMSFGFLGIQFGWGLQMGNMSAIYETLGAHPDRIPILWLAAPLTGLIVQPIVGSLSDRTWGRLGRRRPYFLVGAVLSTLALFIMPTSSSLWMAAGLLWILDASINVSMEPFRAFVADKLYDRQRHSAHSQVLVPGGCRRVSGRRVVDRAHDGRVSARGHGGIRTDEARASRDCRRGARDPHGSPRDAAHDEAVGG